MFTMFFFLFLHTGSIDIKMKEGKKNISIIQYAFYANYTTHFRPRFIFSFMNDCNKDYLSWVSN